MSALLRWHMPKLIKKKQAIFDCVFLVFFSSYSLLHSPSDTEWLFKLKMKSFVPNHIQGLHTLTFAHKPKFFNYSFHCISIQFSLYASISQNTDSISVLLSFSFRVFKNDLLILFGRQNMTIKIKIHTHTLHPHADKSECFPLFVSFSVCVLIVFLCAPKNCQEEATENEIADIY